MDLWNVKHLNPPPINSFKAPVKEIEVRFLGSSLKNAIDFFKDQKQLSFEAALLSRTVYRFKMKFRSSKDFKTVEKLNHALRIYLQMQITSTLQYLLNSVPHKYTMNVTYLPTKHMLDFVLVRLQSLGKLLVRIIETCKLSCQLMTQRLRLGHFWQLALIIYAICSRIYIISKIMIKRTCELYSDLYPLSSKLSNIGRQWLPESYILPDNLSQWLDIDWINSDRSIIEIEDDESAITSYMNLLENSDDDDVQIFDEYVLIKDEDDSILNLKEENDTDEDVIETVNLQDDNFVGFTDDIDVGEVINLIDNEAQKEKTKLANDRKRKRAKKLANRKKQRKRQKLKK